MNRRDPGTDEEYTNGLAPRERVPHCPACGAQSVEPYAGFFHKFICLVCRKAFN